MGKSKLERRIEAMERNLGVGLEEKSKPAGKYGGVFFAWSDWDIGGRTISERITDVEKDVSCIVEYLGIEVKTDSERTYYQKKSKEKKGEKTWRIQGY